MSYNVKFGASDAGFTSTVSKIKGSLNSMDSNVKGVSKSVSMGFASMAKAGAALAVGFGAIKAAMSAARGTLDNFKEALDMGGELNDLSERTGETAGNLMIMRRAFDNTGVGAEKVGATLNKLQRSIVEAGRGSATQERAFKELGLSIQELQYMAPIDQMRAVGQALAGVENESKRTALAMDILGRSGGELLPLMNNIGAEVSSAKEELGSLPGVMDRSAAAFDGISDKMNVMKGKLTEFAAGLLESAIPALNQFVNAGAGLDAAGFGAQIGQRLAEAFTMITSGDMWELFRLHATKAIHAIIAGPANQLQATFGAIRDGLTSKFGDGYDFDKSFRKYEDLGKQANNIIADVLERRIETIMEGQKQRMDAAAQRMAQEEAARAAMSGIMLKGIPKPEPTKDILEYLKSFPEATKKAEESTAKIATNMEAAAVATKSMADTLWDNINSAKAADRTDPGGRIQQRAQEAIARGDFSTAERAGNRLDRREAEQRIQDAFGRGDSNIRRSLADIAKEQGIDTKGKSSKDLRRELDEMAKAAKKRKDELKPGQGGKGRDEVGPAKDPLLAAVETIKKLMEKVEKKLPTHALGV